MRCFSSNTFLSYKPGIAFESRCVFCKSRNFCLAFLEELRKMAYTFQKNTGPSLCQAIFLSTQEMLQFKPFPRFVFLWNVKVWTYHWWRTSFLLQWVGWRRVMLRNHVLPSIAPLILHHFLFFVRCSSSDFESLDTLKWWVTLMVILHWLMLKTSATGFLRFPFATASPQTIAKPMLVGTCLSSDPPSWTKLKACCMLFKTAQPTSVSVVWNL